MGRRFGQYFAVIGTLGLALGLGSLDAASAMAPSSNTVDKILLLEGSNTWEALDNRRLVLSQHSRSDSFLLILSRDCYALPAAQRVGVSASNSTVYAGFDYITADGEQCAIQTIQRLSPEEKQALTL
jgi:hypothetical protein